MIDNNIALKLIHTPPHTHNIYITYIVIAIERIAKLHDVYELAGGLVGNAEDKSQNHRFRFSTLERESAWYKNMHFKQTPQVILL